jgi:hypothetical protein
VVGEDLQAVVEALGQGEIESSHRCLPGVWRAPAMIHRVRGGRRRVYHPEGSMDKGDGGAALTMLA